RKPARQPRTARAREHDPLQTTSARPRTRATTRAPAHATAPAHRPPRRATSTRAPHGQATCPRRRPHSTTCSGSPPARHITSRLAARAVALCTYDTGDLGTAPPLTPATA